MVQATACPKPWQKGRICDRKNTCMQKGAAQWKILQDVDKDECPSTLTTEPRWDASHNEKQLQ